MARAQRRPRRRQARGESAVGRRFEAEVGPIAHGGHCVARVEGRAVFVRHALPGELVEVEVTEGTEGDRFWRADAVQVLRPSPDRVEPPCALAHAGGCGGCDFQHVALPAQRALKTQVLREQLARFAGVESDVEVEAVPGDAGGLRWRTRHRYVSTPVGPGMYKHRSHEVVLVDDCLLEASPRLPGPDPAAGSPAHSVGATAGPIPRVVETPTATHAFEVAHDGFWQVHPGAPRVLVETVMDFLAPRPGERALDLYAGVGLFSAFLADAVGDAALVTAVEGNPEASRLSARNVPGIAAVAGDVGEVLAGGAAQQADLVVLDPPREGAKRAVVEEVVQRAPRAVAYVACDPAALARDLAYFAEYGWELRRIRAFDLFPMTHHVEAVALLEPSS